MATNDVAIGWDNRIDTAVLSGNNTGLLPNLKTEDVRELWQATETTPVIIADFGSQIAFGGTAFINCNAIPGDRWRIRLSTTDPTGSDGNAYDITENMNIDPAFGLLLHILPTSVTGRYLRISFLMDASNIPTTAGRWFGGPIWRPSRAFSYGWQPSWRDASRRSESLGQVIYIDRKIRQRGFRFSLRGISQVEADDQVNELNRINGTSRDILVCKDIANSNLGRVSIWGLLEQPISMTQPHPDHFDTDWECWERL